MESKIIKTLAVLGIPGVALGIFYLLFKKFEFSFSVVNPAWTAAIVVLFIMATTAITFFALHRWSPSKEAKQQKSEQEIVFQVKEEIVTYQSRMTSLGQDVVKINAHTHPLGVAAEYHWVNQKYPEATIIEQSLTTLEKLTDGKNSREIYFDILKIKLSDGREKEIYFDISEFFKGATSSSLNEDNAYMASKLAELYK